MTTPHDVPPAPKQNIELKARLAAYDQARRIAQRLATDRLDDQQQTDTYFPCRVGRLKLREIDGQRAELIWYDRPDQTEPKRSDYCVIPVDDPVAAKRALAAALGVRRRVVKHREIYLYQNVRIHLDRVEGLGDFLEFEAVLGPDVPREQGQAQVAHLRELFDIAAADLVTGSYVDLAEQPA